MPDDDVRRRFVRGREQFFMRYRLLADSWRVYDASPIRGPRLIAAGVRAKPTLVRDRDAWLAASEGYLNE